MRVANAPHPKNSPPYGRPSPDFKVHATCQVTCVIHGHSRLRLPVARFASLRSHKEGAPCTATALERGIRSPTTERERFTQILCEPPTRAMPSGSLQWCLCGFRVGLLVMHAGLARPAFSQPETRHNMACSSMQTPISTNQSSHSCTKAQGAPPSSAGFDCRKKASRFARLGLRFRARPRRRPCICRTDSSGSVPRIF